MQALLARPHPRSTTSSASRSGETGETREGGGNLKQGFSVPLGKEPEDAGLQGGYQCVNADDERDMASAHTTTHHPYRVERRPRTHTPCSPYNPHLLPLLSLFLSLTHQSFLESRPSPFSHSFTALRVANTPLNQLSFQSLYKGKKTYSGNTPKSNFYFNENSQQSK